RYGTPLKRLTPQQVQSFVTLDYDRRMAIGAFVASDTDLEAELDRLIAVGRYDVDPSTGFAECAFTVADDFQNQGVGSKLLQLLIRYAKSRNVEGFTALVLARNTRMMHLFARWCSPITSRLVDGSYEISFRFSEIDKARRQQERAAVAGLEP